MSIQTIVAAAEAEGVEPNVIRAGRDFYNRKNRKANPPGEFDNAGRFNAGERTESVRNARRPSRAWPYSEMNAARTAAHCGEVHGVAPEHMLFVKRIALAAERDFGVEKARTFIGKPWRKLVEQEARRLREEDEAAQAAAFRVADACNPARRAA